MLKDLVSIITPSYNSARFISNTIMSVISQTYSNWELLIVDDCSLDESVEIANSFVAIDERIKLYPLTHNVGAAVARNAALENAQGQYVAFLDSDDVWEPEKLEKQICFMKQKQYAFTYSSYYLMYESGEKTGRIIGVPESLTYRQYLCNTIIGCLTVIINRSVVGDFRMPVIKSSHDMALWLLIMRRGYKAYGMQDILAGYRIVSTSNTSKKRKAAKDVWKVYRKLESLPVIYAIYCFCGYVVNAVLKRL